MTKGREASDVFICVGDTLSLANIRKASLAILSLDLVKGFNDVSSKYLWEVLPTCLLARPSLQLLESFTKMLCRLAAGVNIERGNRQGRPSSPSLFVLATTPLVSAFEDRV